MIKSKFVYDADDQIQIEVMPEDLKVSETRILRNDREKERRYALLKEPHVAPLTAFVAMLREEGLGYVPDFDPLDGGINARTLFLMEKPGPKTDPSRGGSGFISRDNDDPTAAAIFTFMRDARIDRKDTVLWNVIPWWNETIKIEGDEWKRGLRHVALLLEKLSNLEAVVLVGKKAGRAAPLFTSCGIPVWHSAHPSARVKAAYPAQYFAIQGVWAEAVHSANKD